MKFCKDCRHHWGGYCYQPEVMELDPVRGPKGVWAAHARHLFGKCKNSAYHFERRTGLLGWLKRLWEGEG